MNYFILLKRLFIKNKDDVRCMGGGFYLSNVYAIHCNSIYKTEKIYTNDDIEIVKKIFLTVKIARDNISIDDDPSIFKKSLRNSIKINRNLIKELLKRFNELKYFPELYTVIALFFIRDEKFIFYHNEYLCNIRKFIEKKYFMNSDMMSNGHRDGEALEISHMIYNKYILGNNSYKPNKFLDYLFDELRIYLSFRNSYNIKIRETKRRMMYFKDNSSIKEYKNNKIYELSSGDKYYTNHFNNITANEILSFLKSEKLVPDNTSIENIFDFLTPEILGILKNKYNKEE